ncbi:MAG: MaoC family dehydratase [Betaproteobacteria bacterium]
MEHRYFDDLALGECFVSPGVTVTESLIIEHALKYDPQPFHLDVQAAEQSPYGGLIASGMLSISLCFRMFIQTGIFRHSGIGSPGLDEVRWLAPVRPGDTLHTEVEVVALRASSSKPDRGVVHLKFRGVNQRGEAVLSYIGINMLLRRPA